MLNIIYTIPPSLEKFLGEFKDLFIKPQFKNFKIYPFGLQLELKRTNIQTINECRPKSNEEVSIPKSSFQRSTKYIHLTYYTRSKI